MLSIPRIDLISIRCRYNTLVIQSGLEIQYQNMTSFKCKLLIYSNDVELVMGPSQITLQPAEM